ncbi:hypothetical protein [Luteimonas sp. MC1750]|uniref:hypothetical protein n=1 Tax=Luteimonas sp. MC1750 TaxID=2799326 RepID=UPI0018F0AB36|nr:hypothetical protein [Luteimonas sp. MC1750]MBJ6984025.1 hypothetical protein [Luteimonas sp. MC1750]QQO06837.1 hypothetical protein JGR68_05265 [Luteimonas sp. MC1750]
MSWNDIDAEELAQVSYTDKPPGVRILRQEGQPVIVVEKRVPRGDQVVFLRVDKSLHDRIASAVAGEGNISTALIAIIEEGLDQLEAGGQTWRIVPRS